MSDAPAGPEGDDLDQEDDDLDQEVDVEDLIDDDDSVVELAPQRRLLAAFGLALAALVFIGIAGAAFVVFLVLRVRDHTDPNHEVRQKYQARYAHCVSSGGAKDSCSGAVLTACRADSWWTNPKHHGQEETVCLATVPGSHD